MNRTTTNCLRCGAPMNPPKSGHYNCEFCGAPYFEGGVITKSVHYVKKFTQTKGFNSSIIIPAGLGSILLALLIFRYPTFEKNKVEIKPEPIKKEYTFEEEIIKEAVKVLPLLLSEKETSQENKPLKPEIKIEIPSNLNENKVNSTTSDKQITSNKSESNQLETVYRKETNTFAFRMKIAGTIGFRPSIKTVNFVSRRNTTKNIKLNDRSNFYFTRGLEKKVLGDYEGAISDYSKAIAINPNDSDFYYFRGWLKANPEVRDLDGSISDLKTLNQFEPNNVQNLLDLASVYSRASYPFEAFKLLDRAEQIEPDNGNIVWWRGIFTIKSGKLPSGCKFVREARRMKAADYNPTMLKSCN